MWCAQVARNPCLIVWPHAAPAPGPAPVPTAQPRRTTASDAPSARRGTFKSPYAQPPDPQALQQARQRRPGQQQSARPLAPGVTAAGPAADGGGYSGAEAGGGAAGTGQGGAHGGPPQGAPMPRVRRPVAPTSAQLENLYQGLPSGGRPRAQASEPGRGARAAAARRELDTARRGTRGAPSFGGGGGGGTRVGRGQSGGGGGGGRASSSPPGQRPAVMSATRQRPAWARPSGGGGGGESDDGPQLAAELNRGGGGGGGPSDALRQQMGGPGASPDVPRCVCLVGAGWGLGRQVGRQVLGLLVSGSRCSPRVQPLALSASSIKANTCSAGMHPVHTYRTPNMLQLQGSESHAHAYLATQQIGGALSQPPCPLQHQ